MDSKVMDANTGRELSDIEVIRLALHVIEHRFSLKRQSLNSPAAVREYLRLSLPDLPNEVFCCAFLDA